MIFSNEKLRRQDRQMDVLSAVELLKNGEYGILSMITEEGEPYGIPISYAWDGEKSVYIHAAREGKKLRCIEKNNSISFCVIGRTNLMPEKFSTEYESIVLSGKVYIVGGEEERMKALLLLVEKYSPVFSTEGKEYAERSIMKTEIIRLEISEWSGKKRFRQ